MTDSAPAAAENPNDTGGPYQVSLKGIPYDVSVPDVAQFLSDCVITGGNQGITLLVGQDGRPSGEAMVVLETHGDMVKALNHDRQHMGSRYIEVMYISPEQYETAMKVQPGSASDADYIVRLRGLPYSAQVKDIVCLLNDCQIKDDDNGVMFTFSVDGRPSGEAFVELCSQEDLDKALAHNHENMGRRYVEIFKANRNQMNWDCQKEDKISSGGSSGVVRLRGLPFGCTEDQISTFFTGLVITPGGITIQRDIDGRESGEAFVEFASKDDIDKALARDRKEIQHRYIEVFRSSLSEVKPFKGGRPTPYSRPGGRGGGPGYQGYGGEGGKYGSGYERNYRGGRGRGVGRGGGYGYGGDGGFYEDYHGPPPHFPPQGPPPHGDNLIAYPPPIHNSRGGFGGGAGNGVGGPPPSSHSVRMRGLPYSAKEKDITDFFSPLNVLRVNLDFDQSGRPSGEAEVYFSSHEDSNAAMQKNNQHIGHRYIELFLNSSAPVGGAQYGGAQPQQTSNWRGQAGTPAGGYQQQYAPSGQQGVAPTGGYQQQYQQNVGYAAPSTASHQPAAGSGYQPAASAGYQPAASAGYQPATGSTGYGQPQASGQQQWGTSY